MASAAESPTIIEEYSQTFTSLQAGKRELIQCGADAVTLNRFIVDAAEATGHTDTASVLQAIDVSKVSHGVSDAERISYCDVALKKLVALQEEVTVLQKSAREKGISGGLLTIIGQAASQSPEDNGASVLRQLTDLVQGEESASSVQTPATVTQPNPEVLLEESAANDIDQFELEQMTGLQLMAHAVAGHWKPLVVDASVCAIAAGIAISLIN